LKITINHSQTEMGLVFNCRLWVWLFRLVTTFLIINFSIFYICAFFTYAYTDPTSFINLSSMLLFSLR